MKKSLKKRCREGMEWGIRCLSRVSPVAVSKIRYWQGSGKKLNLKNPQEFNEKLMWLKLNTYYKNPMVIQCADKVRVREYIETCGCKEILIECLGVYDRVEEIPWDNLPKEFVLKCNHGAGYNIVCTDKQKFKIEEQKEKLRRWLKEDYSLTYAEMQYHYIKPRIICEKYLKPKSGILPDDYKVYCFNGKAECIMLCKERANGHSRFYFFDRDWKCLSWNKSWTKGWGDEIERPSCLDALLKYAEKLSANIPFVRMDFYVIDGKVYFGEMTFTPCGCLDWGYSEEGNRELSKRLRIPPTEK